MYCQRKCLPNPQAVLSCWHLLDFLITISITISSIIEAHFYDYQLNSNLCVMMTYLHFYLILPPYQERIILITVLQVEKIWLDGHKEVSQIHTGSKLRIQNSNLGSLNRSWFSTVDKHAADYRTHFEEAPLGSYPWMRSTCSRNYPTTCPSVSWIRRGIIAKKALDWESQITS